MENLTHTGVCSAFHLGTSILLHSLIGPRWMDCYSSTSFSSHPSILGHPPSSSLLILPSLCFQADWKRGRKCVDECVWTLILFLPFLRFLASCFPSLFSFWWVKEVSRGPLNVHRERQGPLLGSCIVTIDTEAAWITLLLKEGQVVETSQRLKGGSVSLVCCHFLFCHRGWVNREV